MSTNRYYALSAYFKRRFKQRVQKIPLDAGSDCPNRDGAISAKGCIYCNPHGSGTGLHAQGLSLSRQWNNWRERLARRYKTTLFMAYLQSFTNTYGPPERLAGLLDQLKNLPGLAAIAIGTRPDCVDDQKLDLMAAFPIDETWLELGLQSSNPQTLQRINRGHTPDDFARAAIAAHAKGIKVCAHIIAGLPGEKLPELLETTRFINRLPVHGVKFHNLYIAKQTPLARMWRDGLYTPITMDDYVHWTTRALENLRPDITVQRLNGDPGKDELLAPDWAGQKNLVLDNIRRALEKQDTWQGKNNHAPTDMPAWFSGEEDQGALPPGPPQGA